MLTDFQRDYLLRLPLPLAQLYSRAHNAKDSRGRHDNTFYLCEALVKLAAAPAVACYLHETQTGQPRVEALDRLLVQLALPSLGQWLAILRELSRAFAARVDAERHPLGHLHEQLTRPRKNLPGILALYQRIKNGPDGAPARDQSCSVLHLLDALVQYRNQVFGHGGPRFDSFFATEMGPLLFPAVNELLAEDNVAWLGPPGARLVYLPEIRTLDETQVEVGVRELTGRDSERAAPLRLTAEQARGLLPNRVALMWPGRPVPLRLDPLLVYRETDQGEDVLFLNRDRNSRQVEYLSYFSGKTEREASMAPALAALLSQVSGKTVTEERLAEFQAQSLSETPTVEVLTGEQPLAGRVLGDYELLGVLGRGGMGVVYLSRQQSLGRLVALKTLPADMAGDEVALGRLRREIRALGRCDHAHIVKVLTSGVLPDGQPYYTMEYVPGCDLERVWQELSGATGSAAALSGSSWRQAVLTASKKQREQALEPAADAPAAAPLPLPPLPELPPVEDDAGGYVRRVVLLMRDAARAVQAVHEQNLIHRDVKPANLMLTPDGERVVLMDFGLAKGYTVSRPLSTGGGLLGTLRYAAPEQLAAASLKVGPEADVRGLGVTLWELLTRRRLFAEAADEKQLAQLVHDHDVPRLRSVEPALDRDLEAIVARATERRVTDRIATARELAEYLQLWLDGRPLPIRTPGVGELLRRWVRAHKPLVGSAAAALLTVVAAVATAFVLISAALESEKEAKGKEIAARVRAEAAERETGRAAARIALQRGNWREALKFIDRALADDPLDSPALHLDRARALCALHDIPQAAAELEGLTRRTDLADLEGPVLLWNASLTLNRSSADMKSALAMVRQALEHDLPPAESAYAHSLLARSSPEALEHLRRAVQADPFHPQAQGMLALLLSVTGHHQEARESLLVAELLFTEDPLFPLIHALLLALQENVPAAREHLEKGRPHLSAQQWESAQAVVELGIELPAFGHMMEAAIINDANAALHRGLLNVWLAGNRVRAATKKADLYLPIPPVLVRVFQELPGPLNLIGMGGTTSPPDWNEPRRYTPTPSFMWRRRCCWEARIVPRSGRRRKRRSCERPKRPRCSPCGGSHSTAPPPRNRF